MRGDEVGGVGELRIFAPDAVDFSGADRHVDGRLHLLDQLDEVFDFLLAAKNGFVADDNADDIAVTAGEIDGGFDLPAIAAFVLADPGADHDLHAELGCDRGHQLTTFRRSVEANRPRDRGELLQVRADLFGIGRGVGLGMTGLEGRVGNARQDAPEVRGLLFFLEEAPKPRMGGSNQQQNGDDGAHRN